LKIGKLKIDDIRWLELLSFIEESINKNMKNIVGYLNVHVWNMAQDNNELTEAINSFNKVYCDGYGIMLGAKLLGISITERYTGAFFIYPFMKIANEKKWKIYILGNNPGVAEIAVNKLKKLYPDIQFVGYHHGFITGEENTVVKLINQANPDILFVGMGTPNQELFVKKYGDKIDANIIWVVGALFDYVAGVQKTAPEWMSENGLEWFHRLVSDPKRLWKRYLIGNTKFLTKVIYMGIRRKL